MPDNDNNVITLKARVAGMRRDLRITDNGSGLTACLSNPRARGSVGMRTMLAFATAQMDQCSIDTNEVDPSLWIGSASFDLLPDEVRAVQAKFQLRVRYSPQPAPTVDDARAMFEAKDATSLMGQVGS